MAVAADGAHDEVHDCDILDKTRKIRDRAASPQKIIIYPSLPQTMGWKTGKVYFRHAPFGWWSVSPGSLPSEIRSAHR